MNITFIANHEATIFYHGVGQQLEGLGHNIFWVTPGHWWGSWLLKNGVRPDRLLNLSDDWPRWTRERDLTDEERQQLDQLESGADITVRSLIRMDRILSRKPPAYATRYVAVIQNAIRRYLVDEEIGAVIAERTWACELTVSMVCNELRIPFLTPQTVRIPAERFAFFSGHHLDSVLEVQPAASAYRDQAADVLDHFRKERPRPTYASDPATYPHPHTGWLSNSMTHITARLRGRGDEAKYSVTQLIRLNLSRVTRGLSIALARPFETPLAHRRPFVLFTLHKQPESSIDVAGYGYADQLWTAQALVRAVPFTHDLYIKEHRISLGDRSLRDYQRLKQMPGVRLIHPNVDTFELIQRADLVVTNTGTAAYEAALLGRKALTLSPVYFAPLLLNFRIDQMTGLAAGLREALVTTTPDAAPSDEKAIEFLAWLIAQSFDGIISNPPLDPRCIDTSNLSRVAAAIDTAVRIYDVPES